MNDNLRNVENRSDDIDGWDRNPYNSSLGEPSLAPVDEEEYRQEDFNGGSS